MQRLEPLGEPLPDSPVDTRSWHQIRERNERRNRVEVEDMRVVLAVLAFPPTADAADEILVPLHAANVTPAASSLNWSGV